MQARPRGQLEMAAPMNAPMTMPGPKMPPDPPVPIDSDVATIFATGRMRTIHSGMVISLPRGGDLDPA